MAEIIKKNFAFRVTFSLWIRKSVSGTEPK